MPHLVGSALAAMLSAFWPVGAPAPATVDDGGRSVVAR